MDVLRRSTCPTFTCPHTALSLTGIRPKPPNLFLLLSQVYMNANIIYYTYYGEEDGWGFFFASARRALVQVAASLHVCLTANQ